MKVRNRSRRHSWEVLRTDRHESGGYSEVEYCSKCNARREVLYPPGIITSSDPIPVPECCPVHTGREGMSYDKTRSDSYRVAGSHRAGPVIRSGGGLRLRA